MGGLFYVFSALSHIKAFFFCCSFSILVAMWCQQIGALTVNGFDALGLSYHKDIAIVAAALSDHISS